LEDSDGNSTCHLVGFFLPPLVVAFQVERVAAKVSLKMSETQDVVDESREPDRGHPAPRVGQ